MRNPIEEFAEAVRRFPDQSTDETGTLNEIVPVLADFLIAYHSGKVEFSSLPAAAQARWEAEVRTALGRMSLL